MSTVWRSVRSSVHLGIAVAMASILVACGGGSGARPSTTESRSLAARSGLVGRWAHFDVVAYEDATMKTLILSYGYTDFSLEGDELRESELFCHSEQVSDQPISTFISDEATQAILPRSTVPRLTETPDGLRVMRPATPTAVGIRLDDPATESLPTDPDDPRVVDDDGDGRPGITVHVRVSDALEGEIYIARREIFAYDMTQTSADSLDGTVQDDSEQLVIGTSDPVFAVATEWVQHPDPSKSPISLRRVGVDWDCNRMITDRNQLFGEIPTIDW